MQGQRSAIGSLPDSINIDYRSLPNTVGVDEQILWNNLRNPADTRTENVGQEGQNPRRWSFGDLSSTNVENPVNHNEQMTQNGWSPSLNAAQSASLRLEGWRYEPTHPVSQAGMDLNLSSNHIVSAPAFVRGSVSDSSFHNQNMNEGQCRRSGTIMDYPSSSRSVRFESKPSVSSSSDPFASSSGSGSFLLDEDDGRPGCSMDGRRVSCKRKTLEGNVGQSSTAAESSSRVGPSVQVNPRLGLHLGGGVSADSFRVLNAHEGPDSSRLTDNSRLNMSDQQDSTPCNPFLPVSTGGGRHPDISPVHQSFRNVNPPLDLMLPIPPDISVQRNQSEILRGPALRRNAQSLRDNVVLEDSNPRSASTRSIADRLMLVPPGEGRSSTQTGGSTSRTGSGLSSQNSSGPSWTSYRYPPSEYSRRLSEYVRRSIRSTVASENATQIGNNNQHHSGLASSHPSGSRNDMHSQPRSSSAAWLERQGDGSTSRTGSGLSSQNSSGPSFASYHPSEYSRRLSEYVRRSIRSTVASENATQIGNNNQHHSGLASPHPSGARNDVHSQPRSSSAALLERQGDGVVRFPHSFRGLAAAGEGRIRLVSEIRNVLDIMRRGEGLRFEDVMVLDPSVFFGVADIHDQHRDMRLDVDNMSYEELLALEERIGNVCTGLSEETILKRMKQHKFIHTIDADHMDSEPCCVCQETYNDGEDLGILDCGHDFHTECIKQWLVLKNVCPICKATALAT